MGCKNRSAVKKALLLLLIVFLTITSSGELLAFSVIYAGRDTVDLEIGELTSSAKFILKRDGATIRTWDGRDGAPTNQKLYYGDQGCEIYQGYQGCSYTLERWAWYDDGTGNGESWHLDGNPEELMAVADKERGILHNGAEWLTKLGRDAVSWKKTGAYTIGENVTIADGDLSIKENTTVHLWGTVNNQIGPTTITFANGTRLFANGVKFFTSDTDEDVKDKGILNFVGSPDNEFVRSFVDFCSFNNVHIILNGHRAKFEDNKFSNSTIEAREAEIVFSRNSFTAKEDKRLSFYATDNLTFHDNNLTRVRLDIENGKDLSFRRNKLTAGNSFLGHNGDRAVVTDNESLDGLGSMTISSAAAQVERNRVGNLSLWDSGGSIIQANTFNKLMIYRGSGFQILDNSGTGIMLSEVKEATIKGNKIYCKESNDGEDEAGIYLQNTKAPGTGNLVEKNEIENCKYGVHSRNETVGHKIKSNNIIGCHLAGVFLNDSSNNDIEQNNIVETGLKAPPGENGNGIVISNCATCYNSLNPPDPATSGSKRNYVVSNSIYATKGNGIYFPTWAYGNDNNVIHGNKITGTTVASWGGLGFAIYIGGNVTSTCGGQLCAAKNMGNLIYNNIFEGNAKTVYDIPANKTAWNRENPEATRNIVGGPYVGGNYWDDYKGKDNNGDGIGDSPYEIRDTSQNLMAVDYLPLVRPLPPVVGDIDGDRRADLQDLIIGLQVLVGKTPSVAVRPLYPESGADVNGDGRVGLAECLYILQLLADLRKAE